MDTLTGEITLSELILFPSEKESTLKRNNLLTLGSNSLLLEKTRFQG